MLYGGFARSPDDPERALKWMSRNLPRFPCRSSNAPLGRARWTAVPSIRFASVCARPICAPLGSACAGLAAVRQGQPARDRGNAVRGGQGREGAGFDGHHLQHAASVHERGTPDAISVEGSTAYFDTNTSPHAHFLVEETGDLVDIPAPDLKLIDPPKIPDGYEIDRVEMVIRVKRSAEAVKGSPSA